MRRAKNSFERVQKRANENQNAADLQAELKAELSALKKEKEEAEKVLSKVMSNIANAQVLQDRAQKQFEEARKIHGEAMSSVSSARAIADAIDPSGVQEILQGVAGGLMSCVAAAKVPVAGSALVGSVSSSPPLYYFCCLFALMLSSGVRRQDVGSLVSDKLRPVLRQGIDKTRDALLPTCSPDMPASVSKQVSHLYL